MRGVTLYTFVFVLHQRKKKKSGEEAPSSSMELKAAFEAEE